MWHCLYNKRRLYLDLFKEEYLTSVIELEKELFDDPYDRIELLIPETQKKHIIILYLFDEEGAVGYINAMLIHPVANIDRIAVKGSYQNKGYGSLLLNFISGLLYYNYHIRNIQLEVSSFNVSALSLYGKCGFIARGIRKNYYGDHDAFLMDLNVSEHIERVDVEYKKWKKEIL